MAYGVTTVETYTPEEIRGYLSGVFEKLPCTILEGEVLSVGQVIGRIPTLGKYAEFDITAVAEVTSPATGANTGNGTCSEVAIDREYVLTENWTLTCTAVTGGGDGAMFSVVGSVSGNIGTCESDVEFEEGGLTLTLTEGNTPFAEGDSFTFSTTASGADVAEAILAEDVDATDSDVGAVMFVRGNFVQSKLTGLTVEAKTHLGGRTVGSYFIM